MDLTYLLNDIWETKKLMKTKLGTSSDALVQYPTLITNFLYTQYNNGYKAGWQSVKGTAYSGNKRQLLSVPSATVTPSWQSDGTKPLLTVLTDAMSNIADIRVEMRNALGIQFEDGCNQFETYPNYLNVTSAHDSTSRADQEYQLGYAAGVQDANSSTPQKSPTPIIATSGNTVLITCSSCTSLTWWITSSPTGAKANSHTQTGTTVTFTITQSDSGKYVRAHSNTNGMNTSDYATSSQLVYVEPSTPSEPEAPAAPTFSTRVSTENIIRVSSPSGTYIKYTINGGASWGTILSNSGTIVIPTSGIAAQNLKAKCYWTNNTSVESNVTTYQSALPYYDASQPDVPADDISEVPFYIKATNINGTYQIQAVQNSFHVSQNTDFSNEVLPVTSASVDKWTLQPNTIYYIKKHFNSTNTLPTSGSLKLTNYTGGMYIHFGGNLLSLHEYDWENSTLTSLPDNCFKSMFTDSNWKYSIYDISKLYFPLGGYYAYAQMFKGCTNLLNGPTSIGCAINSHTFYETFYNCTKLTNAAALTVATIGANGCQSMYYGCTALTSAPAITSTKIETYGCGSMYYGCTSLTSAGDIAATTIATSGLRAMFQNCSNLVTGPSELKPYTLTQYCYYYMFSGCKKLKNAPDIKATDISKYGCMMEMFYNCTALQSITVRFLEWSTGSSQTTNWVYGVPSSTGSPTRIFTIEGRGTWDKDEHVGVSGIPSNWKVVDNRVTIGEPEINI